MLQIRSMLRPVRAAAAAVLPPQIGLLDMNVGQKQEQIAQIDRVARSLAYRDVLNDEIQKIQQETTALEQEVAAQSSALDFGRASDDLQDGMVTYLNAIKKAVPSSWTQKEPRVRLDERRARFTVGDRKWETQLGGTLTIYFLLAYHYALMGLIRFDHCHFPGFLVLDFPAELDGTSIRDTENFAIEPFVTLLSQEAFSGCQLIASGVAFENLKVRTGSSSQGLGVSGSTETWMPTPSHQARPRTPSGPPTARSSPHRRAGLSSRRGTPG